MKCAHGGVSWGHMFFMQSNARRRGGAGRVARNPAFISCETVNETSTGILRCMKPMRPACPPQGSYWHTCADPEKHESFVIYCGIAHYATGAGELFGCPCQRAVEGPFSKYRVSVVFYALSAGSDVPRLFYGGGLAA